MTKILITGASGYLASPIAIGLKKKHPHLQITLGSRKVKKLRLEKQLVDFKLVEIDLENELTFNDALEGVDVVIHMAAMGAKACELDPDRAKKVNEVQMCRLLEKAVEKKITQFIYFSTIHVYGSPLEGELVETRTPAPRSVYAQTHYSAEKILKKMSESGKIKGVSLRLSNAVGAPILLNDEILSLICNSACLQVVTTNKIVLNSSGRALRDFVSIDKIISCLGNLISERKLNTDYTMLNMGSGTTISILDLVTLIKKSYQDKTGLLPELLTNHNDQAKTHQFSFNVEAMKKYNDFSNETLDKAIDETLTYFLQFKPNGK